jgi:SAM-dependent methyltransferase
MMSRTELQFSTIDEFLAFWLDGKGNAALSARQREILAAYYSNYTRCFTPYIRRHYRSQILEAEQLIRTRKRPRVLEVGCGLGTESLWFGLLGARVVGLDINGPRLDVANARRDWARQKLKPDLDVEFLRASVLDLDKDRFELIWMEQAFHHLEPRAQIMQKIAGLLEPGGYLIVSEANAFNPLLQIKLFLERGFHTIGQTVDADGRVHPYGNERILSPIALGRACARVDIRRIQHRYFRCLPARNWSERFAWIESLFPQWLPFPFTHYNFVAKKA